MPFSVSLSFSSTRHPSSMPPSPSSSSSSSHNSRSPMSFGAKRPGPIGLWKSRKHRHAAAPLHPEHRSSTPGGSDSDSDKDSYLDAARHAPALVTKHQAHPHYLKYFSAIPQQAGDSSDDDLRTWNTHIKIMDVSTTAGPSGPSSSSFSHGDWVDIKHLFVKACEQYESNDPVETLPLFRAIIHECHRCLLVHPDPSVLFFPPDAQPQESAAHTMTPSRRKSWVHCLFEGLFDPRFTSSPPIKRERTAYPTEICTSFHTLLGTTLFFFGNLIAACPQLALSDESSIPVPYWIAALDVFESGENLPSRFDGSIFTTYKTNDLPDDYTPPPREDWRMGVMWGRTLVALATEMVDRYRKEPPPPPPDTFPSPFPTNTDYLKTGTIWDDEPQWPPDSLFGLISERRPPISRQMLLANATPHDLLQIAADHFYRGIFHMPHTSRNTVAPPFSRSKSLYEIADEVLLLAEKLPDPQERKEWATYANSVFSQILVPWSHRYHGEGAANASGSTSKDMSDPQSIIPQGLLAKARGRTCLVIGSTIAEVIEERIDQGSEEAIGWLIHSEEAQEARDVLLQAVDLLKEARTYVTDGTQNDDEFEGEDSEDILMNIDDDDDEADDEKETGIMTSTHICGKKRQDLAASEARCTAQAEVRQCHLKEAEEEKLELSHLLAEALCSLANLTENKEHQEELYRRAETETGVSLFGEDEDMDEDH